MNLWIKLKRACFIIKWWGNPSQSEPKTRYRFWTAKIVSHWIYPITEEEYQMNAAVLELQKVINEVTENYEGS